MLNPTPVPLRLVVKNGTKMLSRCSAAMPAPLSMTCTITFALVVTVGAQLDSRLWLACQCLDGIAQEIDQDLLDLSGVGANGKTRFLALEVHGDVRGIDLLRHQRAYALQQSPHVHIREDRLRKFGKAAIGLNEIQQATTACVNSRHTAQHVGLILGSQRPENGWCGGLVDHGVADEPAQRDDRRHGVHDLVGQHADRASARSRFPVGRARHGCCERKRACSAARAARKSWHTGPVAECRRPRRTSSSVRSPSPSTQQQIRAAAASIRANER